MDILGQTSHRCVVCGKEESYLKKYVVPHEYRKYFPGELSELEFWLRYLPNQ